MTDLPRKENYEPPKELDGAEVILWAFSPMTPFFIMKYVDCTNFNPIHGFAICRYIENAELFYKFSCDKDWNVVNDSDHSSIEEAIEDANALSIVPITWNKKGSLANHSSW